MNKIRIFIMSKDKVELKGLSAIFSTETAFIVVGEGEFDLDTVKEAQQKQPDAVLLDGTDFTDIQALQLIKDACPYTMVFIFSKDEDLAKVHAAISAGADGCLAKTMLPCHLLKIVELACRTGILCLPGSLKGLMNGQGTETDEMGNRVSGNGPKWSVKPENDNGTTKLLLTVREMEIYELITQNYSNKDIGKKLFISQPTVKSHVSSILRKLNAANRTQLVLYELQQKIMGNEMLK